MAKGPRYSVEFRRRRSGKTDFKKRLSLLKSKLPRLVVRRSNKYITCQLVDYNATGDKMIKAAYSKQLAKLGWKHGLNNIPAAYLTGALLAKDSKVKKAIADTGLYTLTPQSKIYAAIKGAIDAGLEVPSSEEVFPTPERISGKHISDKIAQDFEQHRISGRV